MRSAEHLQRDWPWSPIIEIRAEPPAGKSAPLIGANCAYGRHVFELVPEFDEELDAGRLGFTGDALFAEQVKVAGFRVGSVIESVYVDHHFDADRLLTTNLVELAIKESRSQAYVQYHWLHVEPRWFWMRYAYRSARGHLARARRRRGDEVSEGLSEERWELLTRWHYYRQFRHERTRPRNYALRGLVRLAPPEQP